MRVLLATLVAALAASLAPSPASAEQRLEAIDVPSLKGYVDLNQSRLNRPMTKLSANVLLPDGYDADPAKRWPVLYLLAGVGDNKDAWVDPKKGDVLRTAKGFPGIIVMPESGRGYFTDWWRGGLRTGSRWERYYFEEVVPAIESRYRIAPGRQNHAIGGISMGGYGGLIYTGQFPSYFGTGISMSGLLDLQSPEVEYVVPYDIGSPYARIWGPSKGPYARVRNPMRMVDNLAGSRAYISTGNGTISMRAPASLGAWTNGPIVESVVRKQSLQIAARLRVAGAEVEYSGHTGVHDWPYWRWELPRLLQWNPFASSPQPDPAANTSWTYRTMAPHGNAWGLGYRFKAEPKKTIVTFTRKGAVLRAEGDGEVTITPGAADADATGAGTKPACAFTAKLPFERTLPAGC